MNTLKLVLELLWIVLAVLGGVLLFYMVASVIATRWLGF